MYWIRFRLRALPASPSAEELGRGDHEYVNPCCRGGDLVIARVLPTLRSRAVRVEHGQEDWGWYAWAFTPQGRLAVHAQCDDEQRRAMAVQVSLRKRGPWWRLWRESEVDGQEVEALRDAVLAALDGWTDGPLGVEHQPG